MYFFFKVNLDIMLNILLGSVSEFNSLILGIQSCLFVTQLETLGGSEVLKLM